MPEAIRYTDICKGHGYVPRANIEGSNNVLINNLGAHRVGDAWPSHCIPGGDCHDGIAAQGSPNVFVNGKSLCRVDDLVSCGSPMGLTHSPNVFVNG